MLVRTAALGLVTAATITPGVVLGGWWRVAGAGLWLLAFAVILATAPSSPGLASRARSSAGLTLIAGVPLAVVVGLLAERRGRPEGASGLLVGGVVVVGLALTWATLLPLGATRLGRRQLPGARLRGSSVVATGVVLVVALVAPAVPLVADSLLVKRLADRVRPCPTVAQFARGDASRALRGELAAACDLVSGGRPALVRPAGDVDLAVYGASAPAAAAVEAAVSALTHHAGLLAAPAATEVSVLPVRLSGGTRGAAGPGFVLVDPRELVGPSDCATFRRTAGVEGRCGTWVLAHELAHQWFKWTAYERATDALPVVVEGTADYLAFTWWRATYGDADARQLAIDLFEGRLALARDFATTHVPAEPPNGMTDGEGRALVYGRASAAWIAAEQAVGEPATLQALRAVYEAGRGAKPSVTEIVAAVAAVAPAVAPILERWWLEPGFEPRLPPG